MKHNELFIYEEAARCLLCEDAPCSKACGKGDPARAIRAIRFNNEKNAGIGWMTALTQILNKPKKRASITIARYGLGRLLKK